MNRTGDHHVKKNKTDSERQILHVFSSHVESCFKKDIKVEEDYDYLKIKVEGGQQRGIRTLNMIKVHFTQV
jgi:hypothetical protein